MPQPHSTRRSPKDGGGRYDQHGRLLSDAQQKVAFCNDQTLLKATFNHENNVEHKKQAIEKAKEGK